MVPTSRRTSRHALIAKYGSTPITNTLISRGIADVAQVQAALDICKATGKSLITVLAERLGQPLDPALERQYRRQELFELRVIYGLPILDLDVEPIDTTQLAHLLQAYFAPANDPTSTNICQHHLYLPLSLTNSTLRIAMVQPDNLNTLDNITKRLAAHELQFKRLAITRTDFNRLMGQYLDWLASKLDAEATGTLAAISTAIGTLDFQPFLDPQSDDDPQDDELNGTLPNAEEAPIIKLANHILLKALHEGASDIHIEPQEDGLQVRFRKDGVLQLGLGLLPRQVVPALTARFKIIANLDCTERRKAQDGRIRRQFNGCKVDFRVNTVPSRFGEKIVLRILDNTSTQLGLEKLIVDSETLAQFREIIRRPHGLVLVTGPTGSGKTTTLYSALAERNEIGVNISTAEDPIEYTLKGVTQVQVIREKNLDFATILRAFLRQDPDVILVGETRDYETAKTAVEASMTGHLVLTTLHTNDAASSIARLVEMGIEPFNITSALVGVMAQRLVRRVCSACRLPYHPSETELARFGLPSNGDPQQHTFYRANTLSSSDIQTAKHNGTLCSQCNGSGYKGRCGVYELLRLNDRLTDLINQEAPTEALKEAALEAGMKTLLSYGLDLVQQGATTLDEIGRVILTDKALEAELKARAKCLNICSCCQAELKPEWTSCPYCLTLRHRSVPSPRQSSASYAPAV